MSGDPRVWLNPMPIFDSSREALGGRGTVGQSGACLTLSSPNGCGSGFFHFGHVQVTGTTYRSQFCPSTVWVLGWDSGCQAPVLFFYINSPDWPLNWCSSCLHDPIVEFIDMLYPLWLSFYSLSLGLSPTLLPSMGLLLVATGPLCLADLCPCCSRSALLFMALSDG